jgi:hypothetical protein
MWQCSTCGARHWYSRERPHVNPRDEFWIGQRELCCMDSFAKACRRP